MGVAATILASGIGGYLFGHSSSHSDDELIANQNHILQVLREEDANIKLNDKHIQEIREVLNVEIVRNDKRYNKLAILCHILISTLRATHDANEIIRGIENSITHRKLSPHLFPKDMLNDKIEHLSLQSAPHNLFLATTSLLDLFNLPISIVAYKNNILRFAAHFPLTNTESYNLFSFNNIPLLIQGHLVMATPTHNYLAISQKSNFYSEFKNLDDCFKTQEIGKSLEPISHFYCPSLRVKKSKTLPSCSLALKLVDKPKIGKLCSLSTVPPQDNVFQLNSHTFLLYFASLSNIHVACNNHPVLGDSFKGLKILKLKNNCVMTSPNLVISTPFLATQDISEFSPKFPKLSFDDLPNFSQKHTIPKLNHTKSINLDDSNFFHPQATTHSWLNSLTLVLFGVLFLLLIIILTSRYFVIRSRHQT